MDRPPPVRRSRRYLTVDYNDLASIEARRLPRFEEVIRKIDTRLLEHGRVWRIKPWQAAVIAELLEGRDVVVSAQTGSGKSMCYLGLPIASPDSCMLVICPLLALMSDQVRSAEEQGIRAVNLCAETIRADGEIIKAVRCGEFSMVFVTAEFTSMANGAWKSLVSEDKHGRLPNFSSKLRYIVIDEVHLVQEWFVILQGLFGSHLLTFY
jgi:superfamily II DNA helicase RecQ